MKVNELTPAEIAEFQEVSKALYRKFSELIGKEFFDTTVAFARKS